MEVPDKLVLGMYVVYFLCNLTLVLQIVIYWKKTEEQIRKNQVLFVCFDNCHWVDWEKSTNTTTATRFHPVISITFIPDKRVACKRDTLSCSGGASDRCTAHGSLRCKQVTTHTVTTS